MVLTHLDSPGSAVVQELDRSASITITITITGSHSIFPDLLMAKFNFQLPELPPISTMGQHFMVRNLDNCSQVPTHMSGHFGQSFSYIGHSEAFMLALWRPEQGKRVIAKPYSSLNTNTPEPESRHRDEFKHHHYPEQSLANETGSGLGQLFPELIDIIYEALDDIVDVVRFSVTCQRFYDIGRRHLEVYVAGTFIDSWAGDRIICLGDYACMDDLPPGMLTDSERKFIKSNLKDDEDDVVAVFDQLRILQALDPLWHIHQKKKKYQGYAVDLKWRTGVWLRGDEAQIELEAALILCELIEETPGLSRHVQTFTEIYSGDYVLRNLITKEFIRGDAIRDLWEAPEYPFMQRIRFDVALYIRITWSSDYSLSSGYDGPIQIHRGKWAGHRFDLCKVNTVRNEEGVIDDWKDVSREVLDEVVEVLAGHLGP
ncbi:hypothetical protein D9615_006554 [Tricholomella constricta]|uniref:F-box domain-containing protein n=1 Tax=Tricholomella constricta TaxID=117010 RepID=A0A8H5HAH3_9AGAR|nr:hypothetical protein D9615_006554 [Tricholomella constricta]